MILTNIASGAYNASQIAAFMSVYLMRSITVQELSGFQDAMLDMCLPMKFDSQETIDIVGTGGDGKDTFNISTLACFITAGVGISVTKHGNYGVSSVSGSSNVLEEIGYTFSNKQEILQKQLDKAGICFMHAPLFHPAMKSVAPIRKELAVRTFFNMLGPLVNPCSPKYKLIGVYNMETARLYNYLLQLTTTEYLLLHSFDGYDEISLTGDFKLISKKSERVIQPLDFGLQLLKHADIAGGKTVAEAAKIFLNILNGDGTKAQNAVACINAAMAIQCVHPNRTITECYAEASESLLSKKALQVYKQLIDNK